MKTLKQARLSVGETLQEAAKRFNIHFSTMHQWETRRVPAEKVLFVEKISGVQRHDLRPDLYPTPENRITA